MLYQYFSSVVLPILTNVKLEWKKSCLVYDSGPWHPNES